MGTTSESTDLGALVGHQHVALLVEAEGGHGRVRDDVNVFAAQAVELALLGKKKEDEGGRGGLKASSLNIGGVRGRM